MMTLWVAANAVGKKKQGKATQSHVGHHVFRIKLMLPCVEPSCLQNVTSNFEPVGKEYFSLQGRAPAEAPASPCKSFWYRGPKNLRVEYVGICNLVWKCPQNINPHFISMLLRSGG